MRCTEVASCECFGGRSSRGFASQIVIPASARNLTRVPRLGDRGRYPARRMQRKLQFRHTFVGLVTLTDADCPNLWVEIVLDSSLANPILCENFANGRIH